MKKLMLIFGLFSSVTALATDTVTLLSRQKYDDYENACYSFAYGTHDSSITGNNYEIQYGNGGNTIHVNMVTDDLSFIIDLGKKKSCDEIAKSGDGSLGSLTAAGIDIRDYTAQHSVEAVANHCYLAINNDSDSSLITLFQVKTVIPNDRIEINQIHIIMKR
jgi:hypothetical protein